MAVQPYNCCFQTSPSQGVVLCCFVELTRIPLSLLTHWSQAGGQPHPAVQPEHRRGSHHRLGDDRGQQLLRIRPLCLRGVIDRVLRVVLLVWHDILPSGFAREQGRRFAEGRHELAVVAQIAHAGESKPSNDEATMTGDVGLAQQKWARPRQQERSGRLAAVVASIQGFP